MPECTADATWSGTLTDGDGHVALGSGAWDDAYGTPEHPEATNPEELLAAAHASCYAMTAAYALGAAGYDPERVDAESTVTLDVGEESFDVTAVDVTVDAVVPGASADEVAAVVENAEAHCPVSKALAGPDVDVTVE